MYKIMTPGPVQVPENVRLARSRSTTNADLDPVFFDEYKELCELISNLLHTKNDMKKNKNSRDPNVTESRPSVYYASNPSIIDCGSA